MAAPPPASAANRYQDTIKFWRAVHAAQVEQELERAVTGASSADVRTHHSAAGDLPLFLTPRIDQAAHAQAKSNKEKYAALRSAPTSQLCGPGGPLGLLPARVTSLALDAAELATLPPDIGALTSLESLSLSHNDLDAAELPQTMGALTRLAKLSLADNPLRTPPLLLRSLTGLTTINLSHCRLVSFPLILESLPALNSLSLHHNTISELPDLRPEAAAWARLTTLTLSWNGLHTLSPTIGLMTSLTDLDLAQNCLTGLPALLGAAACLTSLDVRHNRLTILPSIGLFGSTSSLAVFNASSNALTGLPLSLGAAASLQYLYLQNNRLTKLPPSVAAGLTALKALNLGNNRLTTLPPLAAPYLGSLTLSDNSLTALPWEMTALPALAKISLSGNPPLAAIGWTGGTSLPSPHEAVDWLSSFQDGPPDSVDAPGTAYLFDEAALSSPEWIEPPSGDPWALWGGRGPPDRKWRLPPRRQRIPSLLALTAKFLADGGLNPRATNLPRDLVDYLDEHGGACQAPACQRAMFEPAGLVLVPSTWAAHPSPPFPVSVRLCSYSCWDSPIKPVATGGPPTGCAFPAPVLEPLPVHIPSAGSADVRKRGF